MNGSADPRAKPGVECVNVVESTGIYNSLSQSVAILMSIYSSYNLAEVIPTLETKQTQNRLPKPPRI